MRLRLSITACLPGLLALAASDSPAEPPAGIPVDLAPAVEALQSGRMDLVELAVEAEISPDAGGIETKLERAHHYGALAYRARTEGDMRAGRQAAQEAWDLLILLETASDLKVSVRVESKLLRADLAERFLGTTEEAEALRAEAANLTPPATAPAPSVSAGGGESQTPGSTESAPEEITMTDTLQAEPPVSEDSMHLIGEEPAALAAEGILPAEPSASAELPSGSAAAVEVAPDFEVSTAPE